MKAVRVCVTVFAVITRPVSDAFLRPRAQRRQSLTTVSLDNARNPAGQ